VAQGAHRCKGAAAAVLWVCRPHCCCLWSRLNISKWRFLFYSTPLLLTPIFGRINLASFALFVLFRAALPPRVHIYIPCVHLAVFIYIWSTHFCAKSPRPAHAFSIILTFLCVLARLVFLVVQLNSILPCPSVLRGNFDS